MGDKITRLYNQLEEAKRKGDASMAQSISAEASVLADSYKENSPEWSACQDLCVEADEVAMDFGEEIEND